ncbi:MAG: biotin-dependent carboxyltransferase family protein [Cyclobacteriaceae bacterium]|nr:biotin-dependent carboxyltransferase family protein [Cyclobacteriaceae bacterium]
MNFTITMIEVVQPGTLATIQDGGRKGYMSYGIPRSGFMDPYSAALANQLVGNPVGSPLLEFFGRGAALRFHTGCMLAITGAVRKFSLNGTIRQEIGALAVYAGDVLKILDIGYGNIWYLAVAGEWKVEEVMGSLATYLPTAMGGLHGRPLKKNDQIEVEVRPAKNDRIRIPEDMQPYYGQSATIRVLAGPEFHWLDPQSVDLFFSRAFTIGFHSNRMGYRLGGVHLAASGYDIPSRTVVRGTVQLPSSGEPIVLMADCQVTGGYPRIASVISADIGTFAQLAPGNRVRFREVEANTALSVLRRQEEKIGQISRIRK